MQVEAFCNKNGVPSQSILDIYNYNINYSDMFPGLEGSAHDREVLKDVYIKELSVIQWN